MKIKLAERTWMGSDEEAAKLMAKASSYVKCGIYALEHKGQDYIELVNWPMSVTQIKKHIREAKKAGIKVYANKGA